MPTNRLDWTNAFTGRISEADLAPYDARSGELAARLRGEIAQGLLPALNMPFRDSLEVGLADLRKSLGRFEHMLVLGIGGSALGARALQKAFAPGQDLPGHTGPWLWILDNVCAATLDDMLEGLPAERTVVVVISKSGGTIETIGQYFLVRDWMRSAVGDSWGGNFIAVTDESEGFLREEADANGMMSFPVPDNLGGRYSVLSAVGLIPALFLGMDCGALLDGASGAVQGLCDPELDGERLASHPAWKLAVWNRALWSRGYNELIYFTYLPRWATFGAWFGQLWAESLGKDGVGSMPIPAVGVTDQHSVNQMFLDGPRDKACLFLHSPNQKAGRAFGDLPGKWSYLSGRPFGDLLQAEGLGTRMALFKYGVPLVAMEMADDGQESAGRMMGLCMAATLLTGWLLDINPVDQPAVELGKRLANARLGAPGLDDEKQELDAFLGQGGQQEEF